MKKLILTGIWLLCGFLLPAQELEQNVEEHLQTFFRKYTTHTANIGTCKLDSFRIDFRKKKLLVYANERFAYLKHLKLLATLKKTLKINLPPFTMLSNLVPHLTQVSPLELTE